MFQICQRVQLGIHWCTTSPMSSGWKKKRTRSCLQLIHFCSIFNVYIYILSFVVSSTTNIYRLDRVCWNQERYQEIRHRSSSSLQNWNFAQTCPLSQPAIFVLPFQFRDLHKPQMPKSCAHVGGQRKNFCTSKPGRCGNGRGTTPLPNWFMPFLKMCIFGDREIQIYIYTHIGSRFGPYICIYICVGGLHSSDGPKRCQIGRPWEELLELQT